jgi:3-keto-5-aminohexanoate cleavage enzyme
MSIIINFCPTGMVPTKRMNPFVPESPDEIVEQVHEAFETGITIAHLHARDEQGQPAWEKHIYARIFDGIRKHCPGLLICGSTSGRNFPELEKRSAVLELMPDMASLTLSSMNFINTASINPPDIIMGLLAKMREYGVHPEFECFDMGMINFGNYIIRKGLADPPHYWNILLGNISGIQATPSHMGLAIQEIPHDHQIAFAGLGNSQLTAVSMAISQGLGVRIGLEDNIWLDQKRSTPARNIDLVKKVHQLIEIHEQQMMPSTELGKMGFYNSLVHHSLD